MGLQSTTAYIMAYGVAVMASGAAVVPVLLRTLGARGFTTLSNFTVSGQHTYKHTAFFFSAAAAKSQHVVAWTCLRG